MRTLLIFLLSILSPSGSTSALAQSTPAVPPPRPLLPVPTARQLDWQQDEMRMFLHFTVNTFTDREWGTGEEDPGIFNPSRLDARQWARVGKEAGFRGLVLTAKHHDGFTLWPSEYTDHSVEESPWRNGQGDVVQELAEAARAEGLKLGLYLSPWDMHEPTYGDEAGYNQFYLGQLRELLTRYGPIAEVWFDGAKGENAGDMSYAFAEYRALVRQLQPGAVMFSDEGPDVRWIGNERGFAGETNWSTLDPSKVEIGKPGQGDYLNQGEMGGPAWVPGECDVSIRQGWFWHPDQEPKSVDELLEIYFKSVGRNCLLLLNVPPDPEGRIAEKDVARLREFRTALDDIFARNLAEGAETEVSSLWGDDPRRFGGGQVMDGDLDTYWAPSEGALSGTVILNLAHEATFNVIRIQEPVTMGQRVVRYRVEAWQSGGWQPISRGTTVGFKKLDRLDEPVTSSRVRLVVEDARAEPLIAEVGLHFAGPDSLYHLVRPAMGTNAEVFLYAANSERASELFEAAFGEIERVEAALSTYRSTSEVSRINREAGDGPVTTDPEVFDLIQRALTFSEKTGGAFDITVAPLVEAWGFFREAGHYPSRDELSDARTRTGWEKVALDPATRGIHFLSPGLEFDLGGIGKGWALDCAARTLRRLGVDAALLGLGQSSYFAIGAPPESPGWAITIPDPASPGQGLSTVHLRDRSLSTSGSAEKYFEQEGQRYSHIIDPRTGRPAAEMMQVTVMASTATESDALSTAMFVLGPEGATDLLDGDVGVNALLVLAQKSNHRVVALEWPGKVALFQ
jgi:alpha-L-fucosidase